MKVTIYIEKKDFDTFFKWVKRLSLGHLSHPPVDFSHCIDDITDPLRISLDTHEYYLITDAKDDLKQIESLYGQINIQYESDTSEYHLQTIKESLRNAERQDSLVQLVYESLKVMKDLNQVTPAEAIIIAERELGLSNVAISTNL